MNKDLDVDEAIAAALPVDYPGDFYGPTIRSTCEKCLHVYLGNPSRRLCRVCAPPICAVSLFSAIAESKEFTAEEAYKDFGHIKAAS